jgi:hypothetical protein
MKRVLLVLVGCFVALLVAGGGQGAGSRTADFRQYGNRIVAFGAVGSAALGTDVALSADGNTAFVGGFYDDGKKGAAWTFVRSGGVWSQLGGKLTSGEDDPAQFGRSVALSADGTTAIVGGNEYATAKGAAWVYTRSGSSWTPQAKLRPNDEAGAGRFGTSVALSADGNIALVGGGSDNWAGTNTQHGAAWVFGRTGSTWTQLGPKLIPGGEASSSSFGWSAALSADGGTALIGGPQDGTGVGSAWVFTRYKPDGWAQQGPKLTASGSGELGWSVALSGDGGTALIGSDRGGAWVFTRSGSSWTQQGGKLAPTDPLVGPADLFGSSVALSGDGDTALIADPFANGRRGAIWSFVRVAGTWAQHGSRTEAGGEIGAGDFGSALDLAGDGNSAFVSAPGHDSGAGAVWSFVTRPVVANVTPASGPATGGTQVTVTGSELANAGQVLFGTTPATSFRVVSRSTITAVSPRHAAGAVDVTVSNSGGTSEVTAATRFTYATPQATPPPPPPPPPSPGTPPPPPPAGKTNQRPTITILSALFRGSRVYLRLRVCDDSGKNLAILERDTKPGVRAFTRRFATVRPPRPCAALTRSWLPASGFRTGRYTVTVWARDRSGKTSLPARTTFPR